jgi:hypothetical protein
MGLENIAAGLHHCMMSCALNAALKRSVRAVSSAGDTAHFFQSALQQPSKHQMLSCATERAFLIV